MHTDETEKANRQSSGQIILLYPVRIAPLKNRAEVVVNCNCPFGVNRDRKHRDFEGKVAEINEVCQLPPSFSSTWFAPLGSFSSVLIWQSSRKAHSSQEMVFPCIERHWQLRWARCSNIVYLNQVSSPPFRSSSFSPWKFSCQKHVVPKRVAVQFSSFPPSMHLSNSTQ